MIAAGAKAPALQCSRLLENNGFSLLEGDGLAVALGQQQQFIHFSH